MIEERFIVTLRDGKFWLLNKFEPAPPEDWKPICFNDRSPADSKYCDGEHETTWMGYIQKEFRDGCVNCPFRKKEE